MSAPKPSAGPMGVRLRRPTVSRLRFQPRQLGFETLNSDERSLGFFQTQREAAPQLCGAIMSAQFQGIGNARDIFQADFNQ